MKTVNQFFCMTYHLMILHHHSKFGKRWLSGSGDTEWTRSDTWGKHHPNKHPLTFWIFAVTLTLKWMNQFFCMTHHLMIIHHHTKFGKKWFSGSGYIEWTWSDTWTELQTKWFQYTPPSVFIQGWGIKKWASSLLFSGKRTVCAEKMCNLMWTVLKEKKLVFIICMF